MELSFWEDLWNRDHIPFHRESVNPSLFEHYSRIEGDGGTILVPLCGKSHDLTWLAEQGADVWGIELSDRAAEDYFVERSCEPERLTFGGHPALRGKGVTIIIADIFSVNPDSVPTFGAWYDRAALIALPEEMRHDYVTRVRSLSAPSAPGLLIAMEHDRGSGPPFSIEQEEIVGLYRPARVERIGQRPGARREDGSRALATTYLVVDSAEEGL